jgi:hypothetical protein
VLNAEAIELLRLLREFPEGRAGESGRPIAPVEQLPDPEVFRSLVTAEERARSRAESYRGLASDRDMQGLLTAAPDLQASLKTELHSFLAGDAALARRAEPWLANARRDLLSGRAGTWRARVSATEEVVRKVRRLLPEVERTRIELPDDIGEETVLSDGQVVLRHLRTGGGWGLPGFRPKPVKDRLYLRRRVRVNGASASTPERLEKLLRVLEVRHDAAKAEKQWPHSAAVRHEPLATRIAELEVNLKALEVLFELERHAAAISERLVSLVPPAPLPEWSREGVHALLVVIEAAEAAEDAKRHPPGSRIVGTAEEDCR